MAKTKESLSVYNPVFGYSKHVDGKSEMWAGMDGNVLAYLSDIKNLESLADQAQNADELSQRLEPFLQNAEKYLTAMGNIADGQVSYTQIRSDYSKKIGKAIQSIRKTNAQFDADMQRIDAEDRSSMARIEQKRTHDLERIAISLTNDLNAELYRHQEAIAGVTDRNLVQSNRQQAAASLKEQRQALLNRARYGTKGLNPGVTENIQVELGTHQHVYSDSNGSSLQQFWNLGR